MQKVVTVMIRPTKPTKTKPNEANFKHTAVLAGLIEGRLTRPFGLHNDAAKD
jgi:hypothetical protein